MRTPLRDARVARDLTQEQLAAESRVSVATIIRGERGMPITPLNQGRLARALHRPVNELFPDSEEAVS